MTMIELLQARVAKNAFNAWLGIRVIAAGDGEVSTETPWRDEFASTPERGATHGGILASIIDATCCYAVSSRTGTLVTTVDLRIDYHRVAERGTLTTTAKTLRSGRQLATVDARVLDIRGRLIASGRGTFMHLGDQKL